MEFTFVHHPVTLWHPAMLAAVVPVGIVGWVVGGRVARVALSFQRRWQQASSLLVAVPVIVAIVAVLTFIVFSLVWDRVEGQNAFVGFGYFNRFALLLPVVAVLMSVVWEFRRRDRRHAPAV